MRTLWLLLLAFLPFTASAQYNVDRLIMSGRVAVYYEDYVLGIQYFNQALSLKPYLYEPWQLRAIAKFNLDDFAGAEFGECYTMFYVSDSPEEWDSDKAELKEGYQLVYVKNVTDDFCSEFGSIAFKQNIGGLIRIS